MISDSKFVKGVKSNAPKKGYKIEWADGKFDNIFDESWLPLLDKAQKENRLVTYEKEKNDAGYWNIKTLVLAEIDSEPVEPQTPQDYPDKEDLPSQSVTSSAVKPTATVVKTAPKGARKDDRNASFALSYSKDICVAALTGGHIKIGEVRTFTCTLANSFLDWLNGE